MIDYVINAVPLHINLSAEGFRIWANDFYICRKNFQSNHFSPVPYFLLCRAIELHFKSILLEEMTLADVKKYSHDLSMLYLDLPLAFKNLTIQEEDLLERANKIYKQGAKGFEYFRVGDAVKAYTNFPDLGNLDDLTVKVMSFGN